MRFMPACGNRDELRGEPCRCGGFSSSPIGEHGGRLLRMALAPLSSRSSQPPGHFSLLARQYVSATGHRSMTHSYLRWGKNAHAGRESGAYRQR